MLSLNSLAIKPPLYALTPHASSLFPSNVPNGNEDVVIVVAEDWLFRGLSPPKELTQKNT
jgi:hypothetical protein